MGDQHITEKDLSSVYDGGRRGLADKPAVSSGELAIIGLHLFAESLFAWEKHAVHVSWTQVGWTLAGEDTELSGAAWGRREGPRGAGRAHRSGRELNSSQCGRAWNSASHPGPPATHAHSVLVLLPT